VIESKRVLSIWRSRVCVTEYRHLMELGIYLPGTPCTRQYGHRSRIAYSFHGGNYQISAMRH